MKKRDCVLFFLPVAVALSVVLFAGLFLFHLFDFQRTHRHDSERAIRQTTALVTTILTPMLNAGELGKAKDFCNNFSDDALRLSLIRADGKVEADSAEKAGFLGNHIEREEVKSALAGTPICVTRFSESLNQFMTYYALEIKTESGNYLLRAAVNSDHAAKIVNMAKRTVAFALLLGGTLVLLLTFYIINRVRKPLQALQTSVGEIAAGTLETHVAIPHAGIVREIARGISDMAELLKKHLKIMTHERNEKEAILNAMREAVLLIAPNGDAVRFNRAATELFEIKAQTKFNLSRSGIIDLLPICNQTIQTGTPFEKEFELEKYGNKLTLLVKGAILFQDKNPYLLLTITDLTSQRKLESFRSDFIANVSHEIKTPLTCIIGAAETIKEEKNLSKEQSNKLISMLFEQSNRLNLLVQDILSLSALERRRTEQSNEFMPVALEEILTNAVKLTADKAAESGIDLEIVQTVPVEISGDAQLLEQALTNLINNAIKYSESKRIELSLVREKNRIVIAVHDYGIGIGEEHQSRIFERFYRVHKERSRALGGTGLGLAIVKHIAQLHNGRAELESSKGKGCTFRIVLTENG